MKKFINKLTEIEEPEDYRIEGSPLAKRTYAELIVSALKAFRAEGYTYEELKSRFRLIDVLEKAKVNQEVKLEDADAAHLQSILRDFKWLIVHKDLITMTDEILEMKKTK